MTTSIESIVDTDATLEEADALANITSTPMRLIGLRRLVNGMNLVMFTHLRAQNVPRPFHSRNGFGHRSASAILHSASVNGSSNENS
jgi:hypothetical protein